jgi:hypothetical protein
MSLLSNQGPTEETTCGIGHHLVAQQRRIIRFSLAEHGIDRPKGVIDISIAHPQSCARRYDTDLHFHSVYLQREIRLVLYVMPSNSESDVYGILDRCRKLAVVGVLHYVPHYSPPPCIVTATPHQDGGC